MGITAPTPKRSGPIDSCNTAESGCEVVGFIAAADCAPMPGLSSEEAFVRWIDRGYRLEDWEPLVTIVPHTDPAA